MLVLPKRITLVPQIAEAVRRGIRSREWVERLPSESALAAQLQVSRMTLRLGLKLLAEEKLIRISQGRRARILEDGRKGSSLRRGHTVGILTPAPFALAPAGVYYNAYWDLLHEAGFQTRLCFGMRFYRRDPARALEELIRETKADFWVLTLATPALQRWFAARRIPVVVDGSCIAGVKLPALDIDYRACCRHAVGTLLGLGHRRILFLSARSEAGGDLATEQGFREAFDKFPRFGGEPAVVYAEDSPDSFRDAFRRALRAKAPPTAVLTGRVGATFAVLTDLIGRGQRVPQDFSLISRDSTRHLDYVFPAIARYDYNPATYARRLARMTLRHFEVGLAPDQQFIVPDFVAGQSIGPAPAVRSAE